MVSCMSASPAIVMAACLITSMDVFEGFTKQHNIKMLVYYELHETMDAAIKREKQIKQWQRAWKVRLIIGFNPEWIDLYDRDTGEILDGPSDADRQRQP